MAQQTQELSRFKSIVLKISKGGVVVSCFSLVVMMVNSTADVLGRYFFLHPIDGTWEIVSMSFVVCGSFAIGYTQFIKGHIQINILSDRLAPRARAVIALIGYIIGLAGSILIGWQTWLRMWVYAHKTLGGVTVTLSIPIWPFMLILALGFFWLAVILLIDMYDSIREVIKR
jgi:TRAP-type C4-dicarboxylate transport system permease small subunit